jgi:hypothetical protein
MLTLSKPISAGQAQAYHKSGDWGHDTYSLALARRESGTLGLFFETWM